MTPGWILILILALAAVGYRMGLRRSLSVAGGAGRAVKLHSRPSYYGALAALACGIPALFLFTVWRMSEESVITRLVVSGLPQAVRALPESGLDLAVNDIKNLASGNIVSGEVDAGMRAAADHYLRLRSISRGRSPSARSPWASPVCCWFSGSSLPGCGRATRWNGS